MDVLGKPVDASIFERDTSYLDYIRFLTGGDALNAAINLKKLGADVVVSGLVGCDNGGDIILKEYARHNIDHHLVEARSDVKTTVSLVLCDRTGERRFLCHVDSTQRYDASNITDDVLRAADAIYIGSMMGLPALENGRLRDLFARARGLNVLTAMDMTQPADDRWLERIEDALPFTDLCIPSYGEAASITGETDPRRAAAFLRDRGVKLAGVKLGEKGCYIDDGESPFFLPAIRCENPLDLTGAGDSFSSAFLFGRIQKWSALECARFATAMSYSCIQSLGASTHPASFDSISKIVAENAALLVPKKSIDEL